MSDQATLQGDPECICRGTGLVCSLMTGMEGKPVPDPETIAVCECVTRVAREQWIGEVDDWSESIKWPSCPNDHLDSKAWIEGRDSAVKAFITALALLGDKP